MSKELRKLYFRSLVARISEVNAEISGAEHRLRRGVGSADHELWLIRAKLEELAELHDEVARRDQEGWSPEEVYR